MSALASCSGDDGAGGDSSPAAADAQSEPEDNPGAPLDDASAGNGGRGGAPGAGGDSSVDDSQGGQGSDAVGGQTAIDGGGPRGNGGSGPDAGESNDDDNGGASTPIAATPLAGSVGGQHWTLMTAAVDAFLSTDSTESWVDAYGESIDMPCSGFVDTALPSMILSVPKAPGDYPLGSTLTATFVLNDAAQSNLVATQGHVQVDSVTETQISGGAFIEFDAANSVNGRFTASVCPE